MTEITSQSLVKLAELVRTRALSPVELAEAQLQRIDELNPRLNALVTLAPDLIDKARQAEAAIMRGDPTGPLHGVPVTVKDTIETMGLRSTSGSLLRAEFIPETDATSVARLKSAGAIILGKTNAAEMAMEYTGDNPRFGRTNNPHDLARTPGGSSGGEAAAIASCMSPGGLGSDLAGSVRVPSHFCGIAALKPSVGRVPGEGQFPPSYGPYSLGSVVGPMARRVEDLALLFNVLSGEKSLTINSERESIRGMRVAWYTHDETAPVLDETRLAVVRAADALAQAGLITEERLPPGIERGHEMWLKLFSRASVVQLRKVYKANEEKAGDFIRWRLATADDRAAQTLDEYITAWQERDQLREQLLGWMVDIPLMVAPVGSVPAPLHDTLKVTVQGQTLSTFRAFSYSQAFNVFDLPVVVVPAGHSVEGLPIGVQIVGRPFSEHMVLAAAAIVEEALGGWRLPAMIAAP